jgi:hypothetical protein
MRQTTILALSLAAIMAVALFYLKYEVTDLEAELDTLNNAIVSDREAIHVLKAEWSHLNDVGRLKDLSDRHLYLEPTDPAQIKLAEEVAVTSNDKVKTDISLSKKTGARNR